MAFTHSQYSKFKDHPKLISVRHKVERNQAISQPVLKDMIKLAIESKFAGRATEENIEFVADKCGAFYSRPKTSTVNYAYKVQGVLKTEAQMITWIKSKLPANSHGDVSGCVNDLVLGRNGKACTDINGKSYNNLRHCSSGRAGAAGGCTLFYMDGVGGQKGNLLGVGKHNNNYSVSYTILEKGTSGLPNELVLKR